MNIDLKNEIFNEMNDIMQGNFYDLLNEKMCETFGDVALLMDLIDPDSFHRLETYVDEKYNGMLMQDARTLTKVHILTNLNKIVDSLLDEL